MTFLDWYRIVFGTFFFGFCIFASVYMRRNSINLRQILINSELDRQRQAQIITDLQKEAADLAAVAAKTLAENTTAELKRDAYLRELHAKIDQNTTLTVAAADESRHAAAAANNFNEKLLAVAEKVQQVNIEVSTKKDDPA